MGALKMIEDTSIRVTKKTFQRLKKFGVFGQSWEGLLNDMADFIEEHEEEWEENQEDEEEEE
jgi:hypothetical protein